jgi:hypothetical protein
MLTQKPISVEGLSELVKREAAVIPFERVYFVLRKMRVKPLKKQTVETMRICLAIHQLGFPITVSMIAGLRGRGHGTTTGSLHVLGDKKCLTLLRGSRKRLSRWIVSPEFLRHFNGDLSLE